MQSSPTPVVSSTFPSSERILAYTPGNGLPTVPPFRLPCRGLEIAMTNYITPYLSNKVCPVIVSHRCMMGSGSADEPHIWKRKFFAAELEVDCNSGSIAS
nr:hypothetical protein Iba_chr03eCG11480 [Ipomoea batatas]